MEVDRDEPGHGGERLRREIRERDDELGEVVERDSESMDRLRQPVEVPGERIRNRLRLVVVEEAGQVSPARVPADLDETGAEHRAEEHPAEKQDYDETRRGSPPAQ